VKTEFQLLPHEIIFGAFLFVTWFRLVFAVGFFAPHTLFYLVLVGISGGLIYACRRQETSLRWRARLLFYFVAMNAVYAHLKVAVPAMHPGTADALLQKMDRWLIGRNLSLRMETLVHPALTEFFSACYILFFPYLLLSVIVYCVGDLETFKKFTTGLFSIYGLGFLGYTLLPAQGPHLVMTDQFTVPLTGGWITHWNAETVRLGSNHVDVFPSLHCAVSSFFLLFDRVHKPVARSVQERREKASLRFDGVRVQRLPCILRTVVQAVAVPDLGVQPPVQCVCKQHLAVALAP